MNDQGDSHLSLRALVSSVSAISLIQVFGFGARYVNGLLLTNLLGAASFGLYTLAFSIVELCATLGTLGLNTVAARFIPGYREEQALERLRGLVAFAGRTAFLGGVVVTVLATFAASRLLPVEDAFRTPLVIAFAAIVPQVWLLVRRGTLQGLSFPGASQLPEGLVRPFALFVCLVSARLLDLRLELSGVVVCALLALLLALVAGEWIYRGRQREWRAGRQLMEADKWLRSAGAMLGVALLTWANNQLMVVLLAFLADASAVGIFSVANRLSLLVAFFNVVAANAFAPRFGQLWVRARSAGPPAVAGLQKQVTQIVSLTALCGVAVALVCFAFAEELLALFGPEFTVGRDVLYVLLLGQLVNVTAGSVGMMLTMAGQERLVVRAMGVSTILSAMLAFWWIPIFGVLGAALAASAGLVWWNLELWYQTRRRLGISPSVFRS